MSSLRKQWIVLVCVLAASLTLTACDLFGETTPSRIETELTTEASDSVSTTTEEEATTEPTTEPETTEETTEITTEETTTEAVEETTAETIEEPTTEPSDETTVTSEITEETTATTEVETTAEPTTPSTTTTETEPTTESTEPEQPSLSERGLSQEDIARLDQITNDPAYGWWYRRPTEKNQGIPATIDPGIERILANYEGIWTRPVEGRKSIYMTMDLGYEYEDHTRQILDIALEKDVKLNLFITGSFIDKNSDMVVRMTNEGHLIANHTDYHLNQPEELESGYERLENDIVAAARKYRQVTGREFAPYLRPPEGKYSQRSLAVINTLGYTPVFWSFAYVDWQTDNQPDPAPSLELVTGEAFDGTVILLHSVSATNVEILSDVIDTVRSYGYEFYRLDQ